MRNATPQQKTLPDLIQLKITFYSLLIWSRTSRASLTTVSWNVWSIWNVWNVSRGGDVWVNSKFITVLSDIYKYIYSPRYMNDHWSVDYTLINHNTLTLCLRRHVCPRCKRSQTVESNVSVRIWYVSVI